MLQCGRAGGERRMAARTRRATADSAGRGRRPHGVLAGPVCWLARRPSTARTASWTERTPPRSEVRSSQCLVGGTGSQPSKGWLSAQLLAGVVRKQ